MKNNKDEKVCIVGGLRTPIGKTNGCLKNFLPEQLTAHLIKELIKKYNIPKEAVEEVILGNAVSAGGNLARLSLLEAGLPFSAVGTTIDFQCGSSLKSINMAASLIKSGEKDLVIVGGVESTSLAPNRQYNPKDKRYKGEGVFYTKAQFSPYSIGDPEMLQQAENAAELCKIQRSEMDKYAVKSHIKAIYARENSRLNDIICTINEGNNLIMEDENIRKKPSLRLMERAMPVIKKGKITAANSCLTNDGAALIVMSSQRALRKYNLKAEAYFVKGEECGIDPTLSPLGAIYASEKLLKKNNLNVNQIDLFEVNEAFAVVILAFYKHFGNIEEKVNIFGGALAYGHPYGASGAILILHLLQALKDKNKKTGLISMGVAGGLGVAAMIERGE